ncbi:hypothetical protein AUJ46_03500 [Candidatus Peregrinibacteria bacterium CG1_02_54_53]|nr:MAG: hypothetical protein AUJ46_03500 [Candidatus Peregrinibacteria bacterium CG1_02_54_53]
MERSPQVIPERHDEYDSVFLRSCIAEQDKVIQLQLAGNTTAYINPWIVPWHLRPHCDRTELTIADFAEDLRKCLLHVVEQELHTHPTATIKPGELKQADHLMRYLSHSITQHAAALHTQKVTRDECLSKTRRDLIHVFSRGEYIAETPSNPHWKRGRLMELTSDTLVRVSDRKPTMVDKRFARYLAGPETNIRGPQGRISSLIERAQPHLLSLKTGKCIRYALDLRQRLKRLLEGKSEFSTDDQRQAIDWIADAWHASLPPRALEQLGTYIQDWNRPVSGLVEEYFSAAMLNTQDSFESRRFLLEQLTITSALEAHGQDEERVCADLELLFGVWWEAMARHKLALCDYPTLGLAFLAGDARYFSAQEFSRHLGDTQ